MENQNVKTLALLGLSVLAIACADTVTTPQRTPAGVSRDCRSGYISVDGRFVCTDSGSDAIVRFPQHPRARHEGEQD